MEFIQNNEVSRKDVALRGVYTVFFLIVFEILKAVIYLTVIFQYIYLFVTKSYCDSVRDFANKLSTYTYKVVRYMTLSENKRPFPFVDLPEEMEPPEHNITFE